MGLFDFVKICLFSEVNGVVTLNGKPVPDVEVVRTMRMGHNNIYTDKTTTDNQGHYRFAARFTHSIRKIAPVEPLIFQRMVFVYQSKEYLGWETDKRNYQINGELDVAINLVCELTNESRVRVGPRHRGIDGICTGNGIREISPRARDGCEARAVRH